MHVQLSKNSQVLRFTLTPDEISFAELIAKSLEGNDSIGFEKSTDRIYVYFLPSAFGTALRYLDMVVPPDAYSRHMLTVITNKLYALHQKQIGERHLSLIWSDGKEVIQSHIATVEWH